MVAFTSYSQSVYQPLGNVFFEKNQWSSSNSDTMKVTEFSVKCNNVTFSFNLPSYFKEQVYGRSFRYQTPSFKVFYSDVNSYDQFLIDYYCGKEVTPQIIKEEMSDVLDTYFFSSPTRPVGIQYVVERGMLNSYPYFILHDARFKHQNQKAQGAVRDSITTTSLFVIVIDSCTYKLSYTVDESIFDYSIADKMNVMKSIRFRRKEGKE